MSVRIRKSASTQPESSVLAPILESFEAQAREAVRKLVEGLFEEEIRSLTGPSHRRGRDPKFGLFRAGSDRGSVKVAGQRLAVRKPRIKQGGKEKRLETYGALQSWDLLTPKILDHMIAGVSTRGYDELLDEIAGGLGISKSSVSRAFIRGSKQALDRLQTRSLRERTWCAVLIDGIHFSERNVIVAVGIDSTGAKVMLGLREGNTESAAICRDLLQSLVERGVGSDLSRPFLFVIDGGKGLRRAITEVFGNRFPVQRCRIHKARNIEEYLPEKAHAEFRHRFKRLRSMDRYADAQEEYAKLKQWLGRLAPSAADSLEEAGDELLTVQRIGSGRYLRRTLLSTNLIEGIFSQVRYRSFRVKNWRSGGDQIQRWVATCLLRAEDKCHRIHGFFECEAFLGRLWKQTLPENTQAA